MPDQTPDSSDFASLENDFQGQIGARIIHLRRTTSTMEVARELISNCGNQSELHGTAIFADEQSHGRGRFDRSWDSEPGQDILVSVIVCPRPSIAGRLTTMASLASAMTVDQLISQPSSIKWPNDVLIGRKKICGVIAESVTTGASFVGILGIGLNVNRRIDPSNSPGYEATSIRDLAAPSAEIDRREVAKILLSILNELYDALDRGETIMPEWRARLIGLGSQVSVSIHSDENDEVISGIAEDVDEFGRLLIREQGGSLRAVAAGEVTTRI